MTTKTGLYWHLHHDRLVEWCTDYDERVAYIKVRKPAHEQESRLRLFRLVRAVPPALVKALAAAQPELEALHRVECVNCTWNGKTIFSEVKA